MSGLIDSIRDSIANGDTNHKEEASSNIQQTLEIASRKLLDKVATNQVDLDVKDIKDLAAVSSLLNQAGGDDGATGTPQAPSGISEALSDIVQVVKDPDGKEEVSQDDIASLSTEDINKMVKDQFKKQNDINYQKNEA